MKATSIPLPVVDHPSGAAGFNRDPERVDWHDATLWYARVKRDTARGQVPGWESLRESASAIKDHVLARLDGYLEEFERRALANGVRVHWAADAAEHNRIVLEILRARDVRRVVKSKSMLTEECGLNPALEAAGLEVIDTDLGERIVQLLGEPPSHIVTPAIHVRTEQTGELFHRELGTRAGATDPQYLTEAARQHLRAKFLAADAALTGVNFGVADTGGFVVCTNEGNADLGVHLAPLHIASMGIEKLVPRAADLGVFLRLLARSATGQPITVYTSHFHRPRPGGELHVVLVDNGRSRQLGREHFRRSLKCIRCGACLNTCPVYRRSGGYSYGATVPGPIGSVLAAGVDTRRFGSLVFASTLCGSCTDVCPVKIDLHEQLYRWRQVVAAEGHLPRAKQRAFRLGGWVLRRPRVFRAAGAVGRRMLRALPAAVLYHRLNLWGRARDLPPAPAQTFREWYLAHRAPPAPAGGGEG
jgi:L-lactate dehydrogenase complex protein LldF